MADNERTQPLQTEDGDERATEEALSHDETEELEQASLIEAEPVSADELVL